MKELFWAAVMAGMISCGSNIKNNIKTVDTKNYWTVQADGGEYKMPPPAMPYIRKGARLVAGISNSHKEEDGSCDSPDGIDPMKYSSQLAQVCKMYDSDKDRIISIEEARKGFDRLCRKNTK